MHPMLIDMIRYASAHKKSANFTTNATLLEDKTDALLTSGLDAIAFSLPDIQRCTPQIAGNISRFVKEREKRSVKKPKTYLNIAFLDENLDQIDETLAMAQDLGVDGVVFERSFPWTESLEANGSIVFKGIQKTADRLGLEIKLPPDHGIPCPLMRYTLFVRWNGDVAPCCYRADVSLGNILSDSMVRVMKNRAKFLKSQKTDPICGKCKT